MEIIQPYIGKYDGSSIFLNHGKYGPYLNYKDKLYSVPLTFRTPKFGLKQAISIIDFKNKWSENKKNELVTGEDESTTDKIKKIQDATTYEEVDDIVKDIKNKKSLKKSNE
jgi:topoisomerase IA-like protein